MVRDKVIVDIIPMIEGGDFKKVYDHGVVKFNQIVLGIFNQLNMQTGTLDDFSNIGCVESLLKLYFSETTFESLNEIRENFKRYQNKDINVEILKDTTDTTMAHILITVNNIPNFRFTADILNRNQSVKIINPEISEV